MKLWERKLQARLALQDALRDGTVDLEEESRIKKREFVTNFYKPYIQGRFEILRQDPERIAAE